MSTLSGSSCPSVSPHFAVAAATSSFGPAKALAAISNRAPPRTNKDRMRILSSHIRRKRRVLLVLRSPGGDLTLCRTEQRPPQALCRDRGSIPLPSGGYQTLDLIHSHVCLSK